MATAARKDLIRALKALFADPQDDFEPPEALLDDIDAYATSSDIVSSISDHDTGKLRDALLHACYEEEIAQRQHSSNTRSQQLKSILIIILDKFSSVGSDVVTTKQIIEVWWKRLLKPALLASEESLDSDKLHLGRKAAHSAKDLVVRALTATTDNESQEGATWRNDLFDHYINSGNGSFAQRNLQNILIAFGRSSPSSHAKIFFTKLEELMSEAPIASLRLCNNFIRIHPGQAYHTLSTPLFSTIVKRLNSLEPSLRNANTGRELVWVSSSLTGLSMLLPQVSTSIEKHLEDLFLAFIHVLLWYGRASASQSHLQEEGRDAPAEDAASAAAPIVLSPLMDYCTTLYGLFPANFLSFLSGPIAWLQNQQMKQQRQRRASSSRISVTSTRSDAPVKDRSRRASSTASEGMEMADEAAQQTPLPGESAADTEARMSAARKLRSKSHGKGQRSKISKQRRDAATRQKRSKTLEKQKEREKRRRGDSGAEQDTLPDATYVEHLGTSKGSELQSVGMTRQVSSSSTSQQAPHSARSQAAQSSYEGSTSDSSSSDEFDPQDIELPAAVKDIDWEVVRTLAEPYIIQHTLSAGLLMTPAAEISATRVHFKKTEASDLIHEIVRMRQANGNSGAVHISAASPSLEESQASMPFSPLTASSYQMEVPEAISLLQNQLIFETHLKDQLRHRLGALLREHIVAGGAEADRQNLMQTVKLLRTQLSDAQETLTVVRKEAARSRELLNEYSSSQAKRVENLREERRAWNAEGSRLRAELEDAQSSVAGLNERLAEAEKAVFEYENEEKYRKEMQEKVEAERELEMESLRAEIAELKAAKATPPQEEVSGETQ